MTPQPAGGASEREKECIERAAINTADIMLRLRRQTQALIAIQTEVSRLLDDTPPMPKPAPCASAAHVATKEDGQQQHLHEVACMAARAAAGQIRDEAPYEAANIVAGAYLRAIGRLQGSIQTARAAWDAAVIWDMGARAGRDLGRSISKTDAPREAI